MREHMEAYLATAGADLDSTLKLPVPKTFDVASFVGGVVGLSGKSDFPALSIDAYNKVSSTTDENLYTFRYDGQITGMVGGENAKVVEQQAKAYGAAVEMFIRDHAYSPYGAAYDASVLPFQIIEFAFLRSEFFGAANVEVEARGQRKLWVDGFRIEVAWLTSEEGAGQHGV